MSEWIVAITIVGVSLLVALVITILCRTYGFVQWVVKWLGEDEEKAMLTKHEQYNGYMVDDNDYNLHQPYVMYEKISSLDTPPCPGREATWKELQSKWINQPLEKDEMVKDDAETDGIENEQVSSRTESPTESASVGSAESLPEISPNIHRAMSCDSVNSDSSVLEESLIPGSPTCGMIECGFDYDKEISELAVSVIQGRDLVLSDNTSAFDSYVKIILQPETEGRNQTRVQRKTTNPIYKERFLFSLEPDELDQRTVQFCVYGNDKFQRNVLIGDAQVKLSDIDLIRPFSTWFYLRDASVKQDDLGDLMFSLSYLPTAERLTVVIVKARNLQYAEQKKTGDSFVKVYLLQSGKKLNKKKTTTKRNESNPIFNEAMIFNVSAQTLQAIQLRVTVSEISEDGTQLTIGHVITGSNTSGKTLSHWNQMMTSLRKPIAMWHSLRK